MTQVLAVKCVNLLTLTVHVRVFVSGLTDQNTPCPVDRDILGHVICLAAVLVHSSLRQLKAIIKIHI